jgi:hypothetical protein
LLFSLLFFFRSDSSKFRLLLTFLFQSQSSFSCFLFCFLFFSSCQRSLRSRMLTHRFMPDRLVCRCRAGSIASTGVCLFLICYLILSRCL